MKKKGTEKKSKLSPVEQLQQKPVEFLIVGIGASAGGVHALQEFFRRVPEDSHMAYVVILHLSPDHDSILASVLQHETKIPVLQVTEKTAIAPDHIYVVPPDRHLTMEDGYIAVSPNLHIEERRAPVDIFFRTLADQHGPRAISVVLSGTGANGSMGLKRIKERGGATFVQNPREAEYNEMPRNSIATELVDEVLNVGDIPARIVAYRDSIGTVQIIEETDKRPELQQQALREIFTQLQLRTGHDFSNYKRPTLLRRIERRVNVHSLPDLPSYTAYIQEHPDETHALLKDLLISVTNFFRDAKAFTTLEQNVVPAIFAGKTSADQIRIWVAGCATGEEAYSVAMLCAEQMSGMPDSPKVQIFATDIDEAAISTAREGFYTLNDAADVSPERLRRFFTSDGDGYRVRREVREMILFAQHNFLKDPPFSKLDLVTCRNVLIYLNSTAQERVIETFHFALRPKAFLFLGTSESVEGASDLYAVHARDHHIFQTREVGARSYPIPDSVPQFLLAKTDLQQKPDERENHNARISFGELHQKMLEQYAPPSVVINEEYEVVHMTERAGKYFEFSGGEPTQNLLKLIRPEIRLELRSALYQSLQNKMAVEARNIKLVLYGQQQSLDIHVRPVLDDNDTAKGFILVIFKPSQEVTASDGKVMLASDEPVARQLEEELIGLKSQLRNSIERHEYQAEELKSSNEELQAMNEELRSAAEELETSKEELQSINEELRTVNQELKVKIDETGVSSNNLQNLINSANVGTIFLDRSFAIRLFTPAIQDIFNLKTGDFGRPVTDITNKLQYDGLLNDAETVLEKLIIIEREVMTNDNRSFLMRLLPYRTSEDRINGVVITFFDITKRKESEEALKRSEERMRLLIESANDYAIFTLDIQRRVVIWNTGADLMMGYTEAEITGKPGDLIFTPEDREKHDPEKEVGNAEKYGRAENERWHVRKDGRRFWGSGSVSPLRDNKGKLLGFVKIMRDLTEQRQMQDAVRGSEEKYRTLFNSMDEGYCIIKMIYDEAGKAVDFRYLEVNPAFEKHNGLYNATGKTMRELAPDIEAKWAEIYGRVDQTGQSIRFEETSTILDGRSFDLYVCRVGLPEEHTVSVLFSDITARKKAEADLQASEEQKAFLLQLSDALRPLGDVFSIEREACKQLGDKLNADHTYYSEIDIEKDHGIVRFDHVRNGAMPFVAEYRVSDLGFVIPLYQQGEPVVVDDVFSSPLIPDADRAPTAASHIAWIAIPIVKDNILVGSFCVAMREERTWTGYEVKLAAETGERLWSAIERSKTEESLKKIQTEYRDMLKAEVADRTRELHKNYALLQTIYNTTLTGMSVFEPVTGPDGIITDFRIIMMNDKIEKTTDRKVLTGQLYAELFPGIKKMGLFDQMVKVMETGETKKMEYHYHNEGADIWYSTIFAKGDGILVSTSVDITERKLAEDERFKNYVLLQQSEELAGSGTWDFDLLTGTFSWSEGMYQLFELTKEETVEPEIYEKYAVTDCREAAARIAGSIRQGEAGFEDTLTLEVGGKIKVLKLKATVIKNDSGKPFRVLGVDIDVTASQQAAENLRRLQDVQQQEIFRVTLRTQEEERRRISESLHNGLGQLLYGIKISMNELTPALAVENAGGYASARQYTDKLLTDAIKESRRISHELMPMVLEEFGLKAAINEVCQQLQSGIKFSCRVQLKGVELDKYFELAVYRTVQELMLNVVKHAEATTAVVDVTVKEGRVMIRVEDNGNGIAASDTHNTGIGLASIRNKANLLNGSVNVISSPGKGTVVEVRLVIDTSKK